MSVLPSWDDVRHLSIHDRLKAANHQSLTPTPVSYTHLTLPTIYSV